jgi:hypothetical protein
MSNNKKPAFRAVSIHKREGKDIFAEIGAAWANSKGGFTLRLNSLPLGDTILLRPVQEGQQPAPE